MKVAEKDNWTDTQEFRNTSSFPEGSVDSTGKPGRLTNLAWDRKFDQTFIQEISGSGLKLQVGRVDVRNMVGRPAWDQPGILPNETELLRR